MRLPLVFAIRYVFSKKKTTAITLISFITALAFAIGAAAMIIILSAFNGFETTITNLFTSFDPALKIEAIKGKNFILNPATNSELKKIKGIASIAEVVEDNAVVKYGEAQEIVIIKGVSANYNLVTQIDSTIVEGKFLLEGNGIKTGVFGYELASKLGLNINNPIGFVTVYVPKKGELSNLNPEQNLIIERVLPTGKFLVQEEIDSRYVLVSLDFARHIFGYKKEITALEIGVKPGSKISEIQTEAIRIMGKEYSVKNQYQQQESVYKIFKSEKIATYGILSFILLIAAFNMAGALTMLIIEKEKDITILKSMGATSQSLRSIFVTSGLIISFVGCLAGLFMGWIVCWLQINYGLLGLENSVVEAYPVTLKAIDFVTVFCISAGIGLITAWIPTRKI